MYIRVLPKGSTSYNNAPFAAQADDAVIGEMRALFLRFFTTVMKTYGYFIVAQPEESVRRHREKGAGDEYSFQFSKSLCDFVRKMLFEEMVIYAVNNGTAFW